MHFLTKIYHDKMDDEVHRLFTPYSQGRFPGPLIDITFTKDKMKLKTDPFYGRFLSDFLLRHAPEDLELIVSGEIQTTENLQSALEQLPLTGNIQKKKGALTWKGKGAAKVGELRDHILPIQSSCWVFLDLKSKDPDTPWIITTKKKISKSQLQKDPETNFASGIFPKTEELSQALLDELLLGVDVPEFTRLLIDNQYEILDLVIPDDPKLDARSKRLLTKRKGLIHRTITGKQKKEELPEITSDLEFEA